MWSKLGEQATMCVWFHGGSLKEYVLFNMFYTIFLQLKPYTYTYIYTHSYVGI